MRYSIGKTSRLGNRETNQDRFGVVESKHAVLLVVADGMGGHQGGEVAADVFVTSALRQFNSTPKPITDTMEFLDNLIKKAHREVVNASISHIPPLQARTTCVMCLIQNGVANWVHVGDSRFYLIRYGKVVARTIDHSRVEDLYQRGIISASEKDKHPERNLLTRCVGSEQLEPKPTFSLPTPLQSGDVLLLCSDGLWGPLDDTRFGEALLNPVDLSIALDQLADQAENISYPQTDNISAVALRWESNAAMGSADDEDVADEDLGLDVDTIKAIMDDEALLKVKQRSGKS